jgi:hypothetical protein
MRPLSDHRSVEADPVLAGQHSKDHNRAKIHRGCQATLDPFGRSLAAKPPKGGTVLRHARSSLIAVLLPLALAACGRTQAGILRAEGGVDVPLEALDSNQVPQDWGRLVSVTPDPVNASGVVLWFEDDAGEVRMIGYDRAEHRLWKQGRIIRRSQGG